VPLKRTRSGALPDGGSPCMPATSYPTAAGRDPAAGDQGGAEQSTQPPFAISIAPRPAGNTVAGGGAGAASHPGSAGDSPARPAPSTPARQRLHRGKARPRERCAAACINARHSRALTITPAHLTPTSPPADPGAVHLEHLLRRHLEELRFTFGDEPLDDLQGFLICENGNRALITAADLDPYARIFLYLHCLGHLALGHVDGEHLSVSYEFRDRWRLPPHEQAREAAADAWALTLLAAAQSPNSSSSPRAIRHQVGALRIPRGFLRACLQRLREAVTADSRLAPALQGHAALLVSHGRTAQA
jgi:hypothetical protein